MSDARPTHLDVTDPMDIPGGGDELGTPAELIEDCSCGVLFRTGESHRCAHVGEWISWARYRARQQAGR